MVACPFSFVCLFLGLPPLALKQILAISPVMILSLVLSRYDVDIWGPMAERVAEQVPKGSNVCVQGKLNPASWTDREGKKQTKWKVCCATMPTLLRQVERSTAYVA